MFKVTNHATDPKTKQPRTLYFTYSIGLLSEEDKARWEAYKETIDFTGDPTNPEEFNARLKTPIALKLSEWIAQQQIGEISPNKEDSQRIARGDGTTITVPEYRFKLLPGVNYLTPSQAGELRRYERKEIIQELKPGESVAKIHFEGFLEIEEVDDIASEVSEEQTVVEQAGQVDLADLKRPELQKIADDLGIEYKRVGTSNDALIELILAAQNEQA